MVSKHSTILWLFLAAKDFCWAIWRLTSFFFPGIFYIFLKFPLFFTDFFFWPQQVKLSLSPSLGNHRHYFFKGLSQLLLTYRVKFLIYYWPYVFHFFLCWCEDFFPESSLAQLFTSVDASLLLTTQPVLFLKRLLCTGVVKRQHLHFSIWCTVFLPWAVFCQSSIEYCCFFSG